MTWAADHEGLTPTHRHQLPPGRFLASSWFVEISKVPDVVDFHVHVRPAHLASVGEAPVDQLVATVSGQDWRLIVEDSMVLADKPDVTEASNQWLPAVVAVDGDLEAHSRSAWSSDGGLVTGRHRGDRGVVLIGQRLEHGCLHDPAQSLESEEIPGEQVVLDVAPVLGSEFRDDGEVVVMDHRMPGGGFAARAVQGTLGVDDVFGHAARSRR